MTREQFLLMKLAEEASEVAQIAMKTMQFGMYEKRPGLDESNVERIHGELNDLLGIVKMLNEECYFAFEPDPNKHEAKKEKVNKYYAYSKQLGKVE